MKRFSIQFTKQAKKEVALLRPQAKNKLKKIVVDVIAVNPYIGKKLLGTLQGNFSYRLSIKDRIIYSIDEKNTTVYIKRVRTHYGE